jgi:hypothetical protein
LVEALVFAAAPEPNEKTDDVGDVLLKYTLFVVIAFVLFNNIALAFPIDA